MFSKETHMGNPKIMTTNLDKTIAMWIWFAKKFYTHYFWLNGTIMKCINEANAIPKMIKNDSTQFIQQ